MVAAVAGLTEGGIGQRADSLRCQAAQNGVYGRRADLGLSALWGRLRAAPDALGIADRRCKSLLRAYVRDYIGRREPADIGRYPKKDGWTAG